jgi:hypothetical protein
MLHNRHWQDGPGNETSNYGLRVGGPDRDRRCRRRIGRGVALGLYRPARRPADHFLPLGVVVPRKTSLGTLHDIIFRDDLTKGLDDYEGYNLDDDNSGFQPKMIYTSQDDAKRKLTMIEKSSQRISHRSHLVCGRDEITDIFRKVYRFQPDDASPQNVIVQCMEYQLTTTGGRPCTFN